MKLNYLIPILFLATSAFAADEGIPSMPKLHPKNTFQVKNADALKDEAGFGDKTPQVKMMNLMMVEGSGMEGMDMSGMKMSDAKSAPATNSPVAAQGDYRTSIPPKSPGHVGANRILFQVRNAKTGELEKGLRLKAEISMTSMDMGTEKPVVKELSPGNYIVKADFSMEGPWALKLIFPKGDPQIFHYDASK